MCLLSPCWHFINILSSYICNRGNGGTDIVKSTWPSHLKMKALTQTRLPRKGKISKFKDCSVHVTRKDESSMLPKQTLKQHRKTMLSEQELSLGFKGERKDKMKASMHSGIRKKLASTLNLWCRGLCFLQSSESNAVPCDTLPGMQWWSGEQRHTGISGQKSVQQANIYKVPTGKSFEHFFLFSSFFLPSLSSF